MKVLETAIVLLVLATSHCSLKPSQVELVDQKETNETESGEERDDKDQDNDHETEPKPGSTDQGDVIEAGIVLYGLYCSSCHGTLEESTKRGRSAESITQAIAVIPAMKIPDLTVLTATQVFNISEALTNSPSDDSESDQKEDSDQEVPPAIDGVALYQQHCAGCHLPLNDSDKKNKSAELITAAIEVIPAMNLESLRDMSEEEIVAISQALDRGEDDTKPTDHRSRVISNRFYLEGVFEDLFVHQLPRDQPMRNLITRNIRRQSKFLGGTCDHRRETNCIYGDLNANINPTSQIVRQGLIAKTCEEMLQNNQALANILSLIQVTPHDEPNAKTLNAAFGLFSSFRDLDTASLQGLLKLSGESQDVRGQIRDRWRFPLIVICQSAFVEIL